jgi:Uma2 family endonuclease
MTLVAETRSPQPHAFRYVEARPPVFFPEEEQVPEGKEHFELRVLLYQFLVGALGDQVTVGSDQFVYLDAEDPTQALAPDVYVGLSPSAELVSTWKVWERGAPDVAVEIVSDSDARAGVWQKKLDRYRRLGIRELLRFDRRDEARPLRIWDRVEGRLLEREVPGGPASSLVLGLEWEVVPFGPFRAALRIARDGKLVPTHVEARALAEQGREAEQRAREAEQRAREAAEARVRELEAELARR